MTRKRLIWACGLLLLAAWFSDAAPISVSLDKTDQLDLRGVKAKVTEYRGRASILLTDATGANEGGMAMLKGIVFGDGAIDIEMAGQPGAGAAESARGFVGIAFRVGADAKQFEYIYLRPTNGRADDQVRRNHSVQYASHPDYPWQRLRKEEPEKYESYVDLEPGVWTKVRIFISGTRASLYVHGAEQPSLVVNDLKLGAAEGGIALWVGPGTEAWFTNLKISK